ncbi:MAG: DUF4129 domain-containing protein [Tepidiformaceae bacterium]
MIARLSTAASLATDALAFYVLAEWMASGYSSSSQHAPGAWAFLLIAFCAFGIPRLATWYGISGTRGYVLTAGLALLLIYAVVRLEVARDLNVWDLSWMTDFVRDSHSAAETGGHALIAAVLFIATWIRVSYRASDEIEMENIPRSVGWGFVLVTGLVVFGAGTDRSGEIARGGALFYAVAVLALASSQLALSGVTIGDKRAGGVVTALLVGTAAVSLAALLVFGLLFGVLAPVLGPILGSIVQAVLTVLLTPVAWVLTKLFELILRDANPFANLADTLRTGAGDAKEPGQGEHSFLGQAAIYALRAFALLVILALAGAALALFMRFRRRPPPGDGADARMSIAGTAGDDVRAFFRSLFPRRGSKHSTFASTETTRLYLDVLAEAEEDGTVRAAGETPAEFAPTLADRYRDDVAREITKAFESARYAGRELDPRTLAELRERWRSVR